MAEDYEETAKDDFRSIQKRYKKAYKDIDNLKVEQAKILDEIKLNKELIEELEKEKKEATDVKTLEKILGEGLALKKELDVLIKKNEGFTKKLEKAGETIEYVKDLFIKRIPQGADLLNEMKKADLEKRMNIRQAANNIEGINISKDEADLLLIAKNIDLDPNLKKLFVDFSKYPHNSKDLLRKQADGTITKEEDVKLKANQAEFENNREKIEKYLNDNNIKNFDLDQFQKNLFDSEKEITVGNNLMLLSNEITERKNLFNMEKSIIDKYFEKKLKEFEPEEEIKENEEESTYLYDPKPSLWSKIKNGVSKFFNKFRKNKEKSEEPKETTEEKSEEYSKRFMSTMEKSDFFKKELELQATKIDKDIKEKVEIEKKRRELAKNRKKRDDDLER